MVKGSCGNSNDLGPSQPIVPAKNVIIISFLLPCVMTQSLIAVIIFLAVSQYREIKKKILGATLKESFDMFKPGPYISMFCVVNDSY